MIQVLTTFLIQREQVAPLLHLTQWPAVKTNPRQLPLQQMTLQAM